MKQKIFATMVAMLMILALIAPVISAGIPAKWDQTQQSMATVHNSAPEIGEGWVEIYDDYNVLAYTTQEGATQGYRSSPYVWESERIRVYVSIHDDNGLSDLLQHTCIAWFGPTGLPMKITDMELDRDTVNANETEGIFHGEYIIPDAATLQCDHFIFITDTDKYGATAINEPHTIVDNIFINPEMTSTFIEEQIKWLDLMPGDEDVVADSNSHNLHVFAECSGVEIDANYALDIKGTDMEGGIHNAEAIPCENVKFSSSDCDIVMQSMTKDIARIANSLETCEDIDFDFFITVPQVEPADYHGQVDFEITAM